MSTIKFANDWVFNSSHMGYSGAPTLTRDMTYGLSVYMSLCEDKSIEVAFDITDQEPIGKCTYNATEIIQWCNQVGIVPPPPEAIAKLICKHIVGYAQLQVPGKGEVINYGPNKQGRTAIPVLVELLAILPDNQVQVRPVNLEDYPGLPAENSLIISASYFDPL